jgi:glycosyltransferase involved in cell wall biosynthesis
MKIGMMSAWNEDCGASIHAELIGKEWIKMGHQLFIFSFLKEDFHGTAIVNKDENFVFRCFTTSRQKNPILDAKPILEVDYDIFITQDLGMLPQDELAKIFPFIKTRAKTIMIIHHNKLPDNPSFYQFDWDAIVCFDDRYYNFLSQVFPKDKLHIIPYPCYTKIEEDKFKAREKLGLPQDRYILLTFGQKVKNNLSLLPSLEDIACRFPILLLVVSKKDLDRIKSYKANTLEILIREETPNIEKLYSYLHASDVLLYHQPSVPGAVVSSTAYQCLGSFCPILALKSNFFYNMDGTIFTYTNMNEFETNLIEILTKGPRFYKWQKVVENFLNKNSATFIANQYIKLFQSLLEKKKKEVK